MHHGLNSNNLRLKWSNSILEIYTEEAAYQTINWCGLLFHILMDLNIESKCYAFDVTRLAALLNRRIYRIYETTIGTIGAGILFPLDF